MKRLFFFVAMAGTVLFSTHSVLAFGLSPATIDISLDPGGSYTGTINVVNDEAESQEYFVGIQKFVPGGDMGQPQFLPATDVTGLPQWIYLAAPSIKLKPGQTSQVPFVIKVPVDARAGGFYAAIFFSTTPSDGSIAMSARTGVLVFVTVKGALREQGRVKDFVLEGPSAVASLPVLFRVIIENQGNVHFAPQGRIEIKNMFGLSAGSVLLNPEAGRVLPASERRFTPLWDKPSTASSGFWNQVREEWNHFGFGPYQAMLRLSNSAIDATEVLPISFSVWPWHLGIAVVISLFILWIFVRWYGRWAIHRATLKK